MTPKRQWQVLGIISLLAAVSVFAYCAPPGQYGKPALDITGTVFDQDTKQPIAGAYVLAIYEESGGSFAGTSNWCVKTKGMTTGDDGRYHFPVERLDNKSPARIAAIKADYYLYSSLAPSDALQRAQSKATYTNRDVYLKKQDVVKPEFINEFTGCERPQSTNAIEAALTYMDMKIKEETKLGKDMRSVNSLKDLMESMKQKAEKQIYKKQ
jgi:hypothetical protein